jgi:hypothetical protein
LTSNEAVSIDGGGNLKWLLSDSDAGIYPTGNTSGVTYAAEAGAAFIVEWVRTDGVVTVTYDDNDHGIVAG